MRDEIRRPLVDIRIEPLLLRREEAARVLGISSRTFDDLVLAELIGKIYIGGTVRYDVEELRSFISRLRSEHMTKSKISDLIEKGRANRRAAKRADTGRALTRRPSAATQDHAPREQPPADLRLTTGG